MNNYVKGVCLTMCPAEEMALRERQKLLHLLETVPGTERDKTPKADRNLVVKSFSRSAAGKTVTKAETLRPPEVLLKTVNYLLFDVINSDRLRWHHIYDFITDRLMAVRQDMVVQNIPKAKCITILQPIVRFHAYSAYKLCNEPHHNFDPVLNSQHLQECLKKLLNLYDSCDDDFIYKNLTCHDYLLENRPEFEALYVIFNMGNEEALQRAITVPTCYKTRVVRDATELSVCYLFGNFVRVCRLMETLPSLLGAVASLCLPEIRRRALKVMSVAYHSKNLLYPVEALMKILLYSTSAEAFADCKCYGITTEDNSICFFKELFVHAKPAVNPRHEAFVDDKLKTEQVHCMLLGQ